MTCPVCKKESDPAYAPFCSKRCADVDLNRWLGGVYVMQTDEAPRDVDSDPAPTDKPA